MSLGGEYSSSLYRAVSRASERGIILVAAAGNESSNNDDNPTYPASFDLPNILSVAASNSLGQLAEYSNYGRKSVHVAAPGSSIMSTKPRQGGVSEYGYESGTSMAAPHVSGVTALVASANPTAPGTLIKSILMSTVKPDSALARVTVAGGIVDASAAVLMAQGTQLYKVSGTVRRNGRAVAGISMIVTPKNGVTTRRTTRTNTRGSYSVSNLPLGTYTVKARSSRYRFSPSTVKVDLTKNTRKNFTVTR
jgi:subtilisin family serine protease